MTGSRVDRFTVTWVPHDRLVSVALVGFWDDDDMAAYRRALLDAAGQARGQPFGVVADLSGLMAQSQDVVLKQGDVVSSLARSGMRRLVIVGAPPLLAMQVKRAAAPLVPGFVASTAEAQQWLARDPPLSGAVEAGGGDR